MYYFACPSCTSNTRFYRVRRESRPPRSATSALLFGDTVLPPFMPGYERRPWLQCAHCGYVFRRPTMGHSSAAITAMVMFFCVLIAGGVGVLVDAVPERFATLPGWHYVELVRKAVVLHAMGVAAAAILCATSTTLVALSVIIVGDWSHRRGVRSKYEHRPTGFPPPPPPPPVDRPGCCPKCEYDLTGNVSGICPECGEAI